MNLVFF